MSATISVDANELFHHLIRPHDIKPHTFIVPTTVLTGFCFYRRGFFMITPIPIQTEDTWIPTDAS